MFRQLFITILVILLFAAIWWWGGAIWNRHLLHLPEYRLEAGRFHLSEHPPWIPETLVHDVLATAQFGPEESVLDKKLPERLAAAFAANPWVERVRKVQIRYPAEVYVELDYRSPVCLVELPNGAGFYPVDAYGILLPPDYFMADTERIHLFPLVTGTPSNPMGSYGDAWGNSAVGKAARIAAMLGEDAKIWGVASIRILTEPKGTLSTFRWEVPPPEFQLVAENGRVFLWGTFDFSPENPLLPDLKEEAKLEKFRKLIGVHGTLEQFPE